MCEEASSPLKFKINKADLIATYKGKYTDLLCRGCGSHEGYIECLLDFPNFYQIPKMEKTCLVTNKLKVLKKQQKLQIFDLSETVAQYFRLNTCLHTIFFLQNFKVYHFENHFNQMLSEVAFLSFAFQETNDQSCPLCATTLASFLRTTCYSKFICLLCAIWLFLVFFLHLFYVHFSFHGAITLPVRVSR